MVEKRSMCVFMMVKPEFLKNIGFDRWLVLVSVRLTLQACQCYIIQ
jgi:hypothetical protein